MAKKKSSVFYERSNGTKVYRKTIRIYGKAEQAFFSKKKDADKWYSEKLREKELFKNGITPVIETTTFDEYAEKWLEIRERSGKAKSSWKLDATRLRKYYIPPLKGIIISSISSDKWEFLLSKIAKEQDLSNATFNRHRSLIHKLYNDAIKKSKAAIVNPITAIERRDESTEDHWDYFETPLEIQAYLEAAKKVSESCKTKDYFYLFALISLNTGARISEVLDLRHSDILKTQRRIKISTIYDSQEKTSYDRTKSKKPRWVGLNDALLNAYENYKSQTLFNSPEDLIICNENGEHLSRWAVARTHRTACKLAEVKTIRPHDLRHTFASHWVMNGGSLEDLKEVLGHSNLSVTQKYAHLSPDHLALKANTVSFV